MRKLQVLRRGKMVVCGDRRAVLKPLGLHAIPAKDNKPVKSRSKDYNLCMTKVYKGIVDYSTEGIHYTDLLPPRRTALVECMRFLLDVNETTHQPKHFRALKQSFERLSFESQAGKSRVLVVQTRQFETRGGLNPSLPAGYLYEVSVNSPGFWTLYSLAHLRLAAGAYFWVSNRSMYSHHQKPPGVRATPIHQRSSSP